MASYYGVAPGQLVASNAAQGDVVLYDWDDDGVYDHDSIVVASDGLNPGGTPNWDLIDAHTNNRYHGYSTLAAVQRELGHDAHRRPPHPGHGELTRATPLERADGRCPRGSSTSPACSAAAEMCSAR